VYSENEDRDKVMMLLQDMKTRGVRPNEVTFHVLLRAFQRSSQDVLAIFALAKKKGLPISLDSYTIVIKAVAEKNSEKALALLQELKAVHGPGSLGNAFTSVVLEIGRRRGPRSSSLDEGLSLFRSAGKLGIKPDSTLHAVAINLALFHSNLPLAEKLLKGALQEVKQPATSLYNLQMEVHYQREEPAAALEVYSRLKSDPWNKPTVATNMILIKTYFALPISGEEAVKLVSLSCLLFFFSFSSGKQTFFSCFFFFFFFFFFPVCSHESCFPRC